MCNGPHKDQGHVLGADWGSYIMVRWRKTEQRPVSEPGGPRNERRKRHLDPPPPLWGETVPFCRCFMLTRSFRARGPHHPTPAFACTQICTPLFGNHFDTSELFFSLATKINKPWPPRLCRMLMKRLIIWCFFCFGFFLF